MSLEERLTKAAHGLADAITPPEVDLDALRHRARVSRRRTVALVATGAVVAAVVATTAIGLGRESTAPLPPVGPRPSESTEPGFQGTGECELAPYVEPPKATATSVADLGEWIDSLPTGAAPVTPYWHDGVLHVDGAEIDAPYADVDIETAGSTIMVGGYTDNGRGKSPSDWLLLRDGVLDPMPVPADNYPSLSSDGRIAYWSTHPDEGSTRYFTWDTETNSALATRTMRGNEEAPEMCRVGVLGVDENGIAYLINQASDPPITAWDVRADTLEPTDLTYDPALAPSDQYAFSWNRNLGFEAAYVSPDGTQEVFTGSVAGDPTEDCCATMMRVRPAGSAATVNADDVVALQLPDGIPSMELWDSYSDRGTWGVWWETDETLLLDAEVEDHSYLVRCPANGESCELVFDLGTNRSKGILYMPDWERDWGIARLPVTE